MRGRGRGRGRESGGNDGGDGDGDGSCGYRVYWIEKRRVGNRWVRKGIVELNMYGVSRDGGRGIVGERDTGVLGDIVGLALGKEAVVYSPVVEETEAGGIPVVIGLIRVCSMDEVCYSSLTVVKMRTTVVEVYTRLN